MSPDLARLVFSVGVAGLFYLNRDKSVRTSRALWIPVIWFCIIGSRSVVSWFGLGPMAGTAVANTMMDGDPINGAVFEILLVAALAVLFARGSRSVALLKANWPLVCYYSYCLMSALWSDFPDASIRKWVKATGDVAMALVIFTDAQPGAALRRLFSRVAFILIPASTLLIKYYPYLGRDYDPWTGAQTNIGVATHKNILGLTTYILALGTLWQVIRLLKDPTLPNRSRQLLAQCTLLGFCIWNLFTANSATSESCFILGVLIMSVTSLRRFRGRPSAVNAFIRTIVLIGGLIKITGADVAVFHILGRRPDLTGRASDIWPLLIPMAPNVLVGAGFESFWLGPRLLKVWNALPGLYVTEAHNGYIELYLNLGAIGIIILFAILIHAYRRSVAAFRFNPAFAGLTLAFVLAAALYGYTEAGFRSLDYAWSFLVISMIGASRPPTEAVQVTTLTASWRNAGFRGAAPEGRIVRVNP